MSIESQLAEVAEALRENSELLRGLTAKAKTSDTGRSSGSSDSDEKETRSRKPRETKVKAPTAKELGTMTTSFLDVSDEDDYNSRKSIIKKILDKFNAEKMSLIDEEKDRIEAAALLQVAIDGGNPFKSSRRDDDMA